MSRAQWQKHEQNAQLESSPAAFGGSSFIVIVDWIRHTCVFPFLYFFHLLSSSVWVGWASLCVLRGGSYLSSGR